jgi:hypothetical protein
LEITFLECQPEHRLALTFTDGRMGIIDFASIIRNELPAPFSSLLDEFQFQQVRLENSTATWPGDIDLAPEFLYFCTFRNDPNLRPRFEAWGYIDTAVLPNHAHA